MNDANLPALEQQLVAWAREAGKVALARADDEVALRFKPGREAVTDADTEIEALLRDRISAAYPEDVVVGEEMGADGDPQSADRVWFLDPIDGTLNYALGLPDYCISIALQQGDSTLAACVHQPVTGDLWTATRGAGARRNGRPMTVSDRDRLDDAVISAQTRKHGRFGRNPLLLQALLQEAYKTRKVGAIALEMAWVAAGAFDGMVIASRSPIPHHDVAAGLLLVAEAGGRVSDGSGQPFRASGAELVAGNAGVHGDLLDLLARYPDESPDEA